MQHVRMPVWGPRAPLPPVQRPEPPAPIEFMDPAKFPRLYKMWVQGTCLTPLIEDGSMLVFDKTATMASQTIVVVFLAPKAIGPIWDRQCIVKRLIEPFPPGTQLGAQAAGAGRKPMPKMIVEQINPFRQYAFAPDEVLAVHACVGTTEFGPKDWHAPASDYALEGRRHG